MNIIIFSNAPIKKITDTLNLPFSPKEGWVSATISMLQTTNSNIYYIFPQRKGENVLRGTVENIQYYGYPKTKRYDWEFEDIHQRIFTGILKEIPDIDVIHIMGTEYGHSLSAVLAAEECGLIITMTLQYCITKKLLPEIKIKREYFNLKRVFEILKSGIWVSLESLNKMLQTGLDLLVTNLFVNPSAMGLFSIAKQIPVVLAQIPQLVANVFNPELAKLYAENKKEELIEKFKFTINFLSFMMIVPLIGFVVFGKEFYTLWLNGKSVEEINTIQILSILTVLPLLVNAYVEGLYYANTLTNKIKGSVIITTIFSVASIGTEFLLLKATSFNPLIIIAGTSSCFMIVRHAIVTPLYCSHVLNLPKLTFYPALIKSIFISCVIYVLFEAIRRFAVINSWLTFMLVCACAGIVGYIVVLILLFNKNERKKVIQMIFKRKSR